MVNKELRGNHITGCLFLLFVMTVVYLCCWVYNMLAIPDGWMVIWGWSVFKQTMWSLFLGWLQLGILTVMGYSTLMLSVLLYNDKYQIKRKAPVLDLVSDW